MSFQGQGQPPHNFIIPTVFNAEVPKAVAAAIRGPRH